MIAIAPADVKLQAALAGRTRACYTSAMPAHLAHLIFAEDAVHAALGAAGRRIVDSHGAYLRLGAQGPDMFYHNRRTYPSALRYGNLLHRRGYGSYVENLVKGCSPDHAVAQAYTLGFATHAVLDRHTHPYIVYRSGWTVPGDQGSRRYYRCHAFLERILDSILLSELRALGVSELDVPDLLGLGPALPSSLGELLSTAIGATYPRRRPDPEVTRRITNAYLDTMGYYRHTNPADPACRARALEREIASEEPLRIMALHHPQELPDHLDYANFSHALWREPCDPGVQHHESVLDLYDASLREAEGVVAAVWRGLHDPEHAGAISGVIGDHPLDHNRPGEGSCPPIHSDPFPLHEILDSYRAAAV